jgi:uncharacterized protein
VGNPPSANDGVRAWFRAVAPAAAFTDIDRRGYHQSGGATVANEPCPAAKEGQMGFEQYHEPPEELSHKTRTFARMIASLIEEAEAISWYEQRIALEKDSEARAIMENAQKEEFKHFGMNLEFLLRRKDDWRTELKEILFTTGDIVERGEAGEKKVD